MVAWFRALMPKEEKFFPLFARQSQLLVAGAEALRAMLEGGEAVARHCQTVMDREQDADDVTREILIAVRRSFITPFDRSDITDLITAMDDTIDQMQKTAKAITLFDVRSFEPPMQQMGGSVVECARLVSEAVPLLSDINRHAARLGAISEQISRIEGHADDLHDAGLKMLYQKHAASSPMAFVIGNEIYDHLEKVVDRFDDVANEINGIVVEQV